MEFLIRRQRSVRQLGILSGTFHPVTRAHLELAAAALAHVDEVLFVMPRQLPHKTYDWAFLDDRIAMVARAIAGHAAFSCAVTQGGLFAEISRECAPAFPGAGQWFLCGRDAAERIVSWDYGPGASFATQLEAFGLLVAARQGEYTPPAEFAGRILPLVISPIWDDLSATEVRRRIQAGLPWEHLVPEPAVELARQVYLAPPPAKR